MNRKELEITLSRNIQTFSTPKIHLEQYQTPPRVAANLLFRAFQLGDINDKTVVDLCAGTGILAIGAKLLGGKLTAVEIDPDAVALMQVNIDRIQLDVDVIIADALNYDFKIQFDTAILNPPFGIQQKRMKDIAFISKAHEIATTVYSIIDGSEENRNNINKLLRRRNIRIIESYIDEFPMKSTYPWHTMKRKIHSVLILRTIYLNSI